MGAKIHLHKSCKELEGDLKIFKGRLVPTSYEKGAFHWNQNTLGGKYE